MSNIVPGHMLVNTVQYGGHVLGAYDNDRMIGAAIAFLGTLIPVDDPRPAGDALAIMSKRAIVLPEYRGAGVGEALKRMQYEIAIRQGIQLIRWTFDPVLSRNAYFNISKLGTVIQHYEENYFGEAAAHPTLEADRVVANWWVGHSHSEAHLQNNLAKPVLSQLQSQSGTLVIERLTPDNCVDSPESVPDVTGYETILVSLPFDFSAIEVENSEHARQWRDFLRDALKTCLAAGYIITGFVREGERVFYMLTLDTGTYHFKDDV
ncbi:MAG: hypothetical protein ACPG7F_10470 [Aggregatilineales bacterium]